MAGKFIKHYRRLGLIGGGVRQPDTSADYWVELAEIGDARLVHTSGDETIAGSKRFSRNIYVDGQALSYRIVDSTYKNGDIPEDTTWHGSFTFYDSTGDDSACGRLGHVRAFTYDTGTRGIALKVNNNTADTEEIMNYGVEVLKPFGGDPYTTATSTRDTPQDNEVVTVDYLSKNNGLVHLSGIETITGSKTFTGDILILGAASGAGGDLSPQIDLLFADLNEYEAPATAKECGFVVHQGPANGSRSIGGTQFYLKTDGTNEARISVASLLEQKDTRLSVFYPSTGDPYATAPNTRETPQDNEIVTVDFLKKYVAEALSQASTSGSGFPEPELQPTVPDAGV